MESNLNPQLAAVWLDALLKSFVVLAFAGGLCLAWRRAAAATRHLIWFFGVVGLLLLPLLPFVLPSTPRPLWTVSGGHSSGNEIALSLELAPAKPASAIAEPVSPGRAPIQSPQQSMRRAFNAHVSRNWVSIGFGAWVFGALIVLLYPVLGRIQLVRLERNTEVLADSEWTALLAEASQLLSLRRRVVLLQSRASVMPLTWGWLWPKVLMPTKAERWPAERQRVVLLHELAHVKRRDCLTQGIAQLVCALYWFNPLVWMAAHQMRIERERACDDLVLNGGCKASDYAGHLVEIATTFRRAPQGAGIAMARSSNLEQRVTAIVDVSRARRLRPAGVVGILICIGAVVFYIGGYKTNAADNDRTSSAGKETLAQIKRFSVEKEAQAKLLAAAAGEKILPQFQKYFDAAKKGDFQTVTNMYADFKQHHPQYSHSGGKDSRPAYHTSYWQPMLEISLVYDHFAMSDAKFTQEAVRDIFNSIPPGSIYFGGTDPGRGLPTAFSKSHVDADPFYALSQNPLADGSYEDYLRKMYGEKRRILPQFAAARQADPELSKLDKQLVAAQEKALSLEMSKPDNDPARVAADKAVDDLSAKVDAALARVGKAVNADENSAAAKAWPSDKVIYIPTTNDVQKAFEDYREDAGRRKQHDETFPSEPKQIRPGEDIKVDADGKVQVAGQVTVQAINARISKLIFDKNPNREFFVEESFPHDWMYPYLEPNGLIMKINREPLAELPDEIIQKDEDYWQTRVDKWLGKWLTPETPVEAIADFATKVYGRKNLDGFTGDPDFVRDAYAPKMFSKWRMGMAGVYSWRLGIGFVKMQSEYAPKSAAEKQKLKQAADFALKQAFAICPSSPEAVFRYVDFLVKEGRKNDAMAIAHAAAIIDPKNDNFRFLEKNVSAQGKSSSTDSQAGELAKTAEKLKKEEAIRGQKEVLFAQQDALLSRLKALSQEERTKAITDEQLNKLRAELDALGQKLNSAAQDHRTRDQAIQDVQALTKDLRQQIETRMQEMKPEMESKLRDAAAALAQVKEQLEKVREELQNAR